jgi:hypothetical protein
MARYRVTGRRRVRGFLPGDIFEARLDGLAEARAVARGDLEVIERFTPSIQPGTYSLPDGWLNQNEEVQ